MKQTIGGLLVLAVLFIGCGDKRQSGSGAAANGELVVTSSAFKNGGPIPAVYTADGDNMSPPLDWSGAPESTRSFVLICDDPDAPTGLFVHWIVYNIPPGVNGFDENVPPYDELYDGIRQGLNDFGRYGYGGPAPPRGTHRYYFKVYALDRMLDLDGRVTRKDLMRAIEDHILARGQVMGKYTR
jgi:Raf kinase inhibitor-like YbhB/YbcL family protein